jgi:hypothetical protein
MLENDSIRCRVTFGDDHKWAILTAPNCRPLSSFANSTIKCDQWDRWLSWLVNNHPSGDPTPSRADIDLTKAIVDIAKPLGIAVHDHIIVGKQGHASLKGLRLI